MKNFGLLLMCLMVPLLSYSQLNLRLNAGYSKDCSTHHLGNNTTYTGTSFSPSSVEHICGSYGKGINLGLGAGYNFNKNWGLDLGIDYFSGSQVTSEIQTWDDRTFEKIGYSRQLNLTPSVYMEVFPCDDDDDDFGLYGRVGPIIPVYNRFFFEETYEGEFDATPGLDTEFIRTQYNLSSKIGLNAAVGVNYRFTDNLGVFAEINSHGLTSTTKSSEIVEYTFNGMDELSKLNNYQSMVNYHERLDETSNNFLVNSSPNTDLPQDLLTEKVPFSNLGIGIGLRYTFGRPDVQSR